MTDLEKATEAYRAAMAAHDRAYARGQTKVLINITGPALSAALKNLRMLEKA
jgi:hypothetical protein